MLWRYIGVAALAGLGAMVNFCSLFILLNKKFSFNLGCFCTIKCSYIKFCKETKKEEIKAIRF
jgi:hypothetical protein